MTDITITVKLELSEKLEQQIERLTTALVQGTFRWEDEDDNQDEAGATD
jgi:hypothetical protein